MYICTLTLVESMRMTPKLDKISSNSMRILLVTGIGANPWLFKDLFNLEEYFLPKKHFPSSRRLFEFRAADVES